MAHGSVDDLKFMMALIMADDYLLDARAVGELPPRIGRVAQFPIGNASGNARKRVEKPVEGSSGDSE